MEQVQVCGYLRVSGKGQVKHGYGLEEQQEQIIKYCTDNNFDLVKIFKDKGISGATESEDDTTLNREGLLDMLERVEHGDIKYIVVLSTNRLWRAENVKFAIRRILKKYSVDIKAIDRPTYSIYSTNPSDVLVNMVFEGIDAYERLDIALKLKRGRLRKAAKGKMSGGGIPYGYTIDKAKHILVVDPWESMAVVIVFQLRKQGYTLQKIADELNRLGYSRRKDGGDIYPMLVKSILDNEEFYRGIYKYAGIKVKGQHAPIFEELPKSVDDDTLSTDI